MIKLFEITTRILRTNIIILCVLYALTGDIVTILVGFATGMECTVWFYDYLEKKYGKNN